MLRKTLKNEKGIAFIEGVWVILIFGLLIALLSPLFRNFLSGTEDEPGFAGRIVESKTYGIDERNSDLVLSEGCDSSSSDVTYDECSALK